MKFSIISICKVLVLITGLCLSFPSWSQVTKQQDFSNVKVDELTDAQIRQFISQVEASGLSQAQLEQVAQARGMKPEEIQKLRERVNSLNKSGQQNNGITNKPSQQQTSRTYTQPDSSNAALRKDSLSLAEQALTSLRPKIFGAELFQNPGMSFQPNLRIATPKNYVVGPDDEILIDITGDNEANYRLKVNPEGFIRVEYVGIIPVSGITIEEATRRIKARLQQTYPAMRNGRTGLAVSIGNIRSIQVILIGEVVRPGAWTLSSLSTVFNALYQSGGPTNNGSFREIEVIRNNKVIAKIDVYDFLLKGYQTTNIRLQDQDVIRIPTYKVHVELAGEVKHPAIFEVLPNENLKDVLNFAGGFSDKAYTARIKVIQNTSVARKFGDLSAESYASYRPNNGDKFFVDVILNRFENRVTIQGAVFRPGQFELQPGLTLSQLIRKADGITEDAFLSRGSISRLQPDNSKALIPFDVATIIAGSAPDIVLMREDIVTISSIFNLRDEYKVTIDGEIRQPGTFSYSEKMSLEDLVILAGGFAEGASPKRIEVSRRIKNSDIKSASAKTADVFQVNVDKDLHLLGEKFILQPFDIVTVRNETGYEIQRRIKVEGEVAYPGTYTISNKGERISDVIRRAGGLTALAAPAGASLKRPGVETTVNKNKIDKADEDQEKLVKFQRLQSTAKDSADLAQQQIILQNVYVGINLEKILQKPGSKIDLQIEEGDILRVPKLLQTVKITGEVLFPVTTIYNNSKGFKSYISDAGGFSDKSLKRRAYVLYANGSVKSTKKFLFFNNYPVINPGSEIFVPQKEEKNKLSAQEVVGIASGLASIGAIILGILNLSK